MATQEQRNEAIKTARMMPRQTYSHPPVNHTRYGFWVNDHPKGDPKLAGKYLASWRTFDEAVVAAYCLGVNPYNIEYVQHIVPDTWRRESQ